MRACGHSNQARSTISIFWRPNWVFIYTGLARGHRTCSVGPAPRNEESVTVTLTPDTHTPLPVPLTPPRHSPHHTKPYHTSPYHITPYHITPFQGTPHRRPSETHRAYPPSRPSAAEQSQRASRSHRDMKVSSCGRPRRSSARWDKLRRGELVFDVWRCIKHEIKAAEQGATYRCSFIFVPCGVWSSQCASSSFSAVFIRNACHVAHSTRTRYIQHT